MLSSAIKELLAVGSVKHALHLDKPKYTRTGGYYFFGKPTNYQGCLVLFLSLLEAAVVVKSSSILV